MGKVYLVGAGPGDPGLLTLRGRDCLACAEAVVYDALVDPAFLAFAPRAETVYAGKEASRHSLPQADINRILISLARRHAVVVRLKGGDPFVFGRGGEEAAALVEAGIPYEVVPGVTAGIAAPAYAGIPLTRRGLASTLSFIAGHTRDNDKPFDIPAMVASGTLVFYMGVRNMPRIVTAVLAMGRSPETPAAVIEWGTLARQRTIVGTLSDLHARCVAAAVEAPALIVVGETVALRENLAWFEARPLHGLRIAVTHTTQRRGALERRLTDLGAEVFSFPTLTIEPVADSAMDFTPGEYDWVVLTSVNSADLLFEGLARRGQDARALAGVRLCAVGNAAVDAIERRFLHVDAVAPGYRPHEVLAAMGPLRDKRVLLPRADITRSSLAAALREAGARVTEVAACETRPRTPDAEALAALRDFSPEVVVFTNATAAANFARVAGDTVAPETVFASIGPVTTQAARSAGLAIAIEPARHDLPNLVEAICAWRAKSVQRDS